MAERLTTLLSIAGSDPMGGAGIQADLRTGNFLGLHVLTAITAVTSQNSHEVKDLGVVSPQILKYQLDAIFEDVIPDAVKIGMIGSQENLFIIKEFLEQLPKNIPVVVDPVFAASADNKLMTLHEKEKWGDLYKNYLFPLSTVITPNIDELLILFNHLDIASMSINELQKSFPLRNMVVTGWKKDKDEICDLLIWDDKNYIYPHKLIECKNLHGTGCCFSSLLAANLARGKDIFDAVGLTHKMMEEIIENSCHYSLGKSQYGPLNISKYTL